MTIKESSAYLRLPYIGNNYEDEIKEARIANTDPKDFLEQLLLKEVELRRENGNRARLRRARFPYKKLLEDFQRNRYNSSMQREISTLETLDFINERENAILIGTPGSGKTHLAIGLGIKACLAGKTVLFTSVANLLIELNEALHTSVLTSYKRKFEQYDLVILDELGYVSFHKEDSELLFNLISSRYNKGSVIITTNLSFDSWSQIFGDTMVTSALIDRLAFKAHVLDMSLDTSFRYEETIAWMAKKK